MHGISACVTDAILPDNSGTEVLVRENLLADFQQSCRYLWLGCSKALLSVRVLGIDDRAARKNDCHSDDRMVRIDCWPATHTTRVIGQYATDCRRVNARRVRPHAA